jgi:hypothetical protein
MTDQLLSLAREVGAEGYMYGRTPPVVVTEFTHSQLTAFAAAIREEERERCAALMERRAQDVKKSNTRGSRIGQAALFAVDQLEFGASAIRSSGTSGSKSDE